MKSRLVRKTQTPAAIGAGEWRPILPTHAVESDLAASLKLFFQNVLLVAFSQKQVAWDPGKVAVDSFLPDDLLDPINRGHEALIQVAGFFLPAHIDELVVAVI